MRSKEKANLEPRSDLQGNRITNRILCSISDGEFRKVRPALEFVKLDQHRSLKKERDHGRFLQLIRELNDLLERKEQRLEDDTGDLAR